MKYFLIPSLVGGLLVSALHAQADVSVSLLEQAPVENVLTSYYIPDGVGSGYQWRNDSNAGVNRRDLGQSFAATSNATLNTIGLQLWGNFQSGARNADITVTIWQLATATATPSTSGSQLISTQTGVMPNATGGAGSFVNFELDAVELIAGNHYLFMLSFDSTAANRNLVFRTLEHGTYEGGSVVEAALSGDSLSYSRLQSDLSFYIQATPIPEPGAAVVLLPAAGLAALLVRRRRKNGAVCVK